MHTGGVRPVIPPEVEGLAEPMRSRWSPSVFDADHEIAYDDLDLLLRAAQWAPSFGNTQPWSFLVLARGSAGHEQFLPFLSRGNSGWVPRASVVLLAGTRIAPDPPAEDADDGAEPKPVDATYSYYDLGQAVAHLTLQAQAMGLHAHQFAGFDREAAARALGVPAHVRTPVGVAIGRRGDIEGASERDRDREQRPRTRAPLTRSVHLGHWGVTWEPSLGAHP